MAGGSEMETMERVKGKRILVTGGTGFVGSHLVEALILGGASVVVLERSADPFSYFSTQNFENKVIMAAGDVKDGQRVFDVVAKYEIEYIFHLAALATVPVAYDNPLETIATNVMGTTHVLEAARRIPRVKGVIVASSDKAYGKSDKPCEENDPLRGDHPYEASKSSADLIAIAYAKTYQTPVVVTRFGNIYGEGDLNFNRIIPGAFKAILTNTVLELRSDGTFVRDYVYVKDVVRGYLLLLDKIQQTQGNAYNISSGESLTVLDALNAIEAVIGQKVKYTILNTQKNEIPYQSLNFNKVKALGFASIYILKKTLPGVYAWYKTIL